MESVRRCKDCKRIVRGHAGDACPYCGSDRLVIATPGTAGRHHASVLTAALTFCFGLILLRMIATFMGTRLGALMLIHSELTSLQMLVAVCTVLYVVLRRSEGDFHAL